MSSLQNRVAKPKSKKKGTSVVSCVEKFLHDGSATPAMKKTVRKELEDLKSEFEALMNKLSSAGENKAEKIKPNYHYVDMFKSIFDAVSKDIESNLKLIPKRKPGNEEDVKYFPRLYWIRLMISWSLSKMLKRSQISIPTNVNPMRQMKKLKKL